MSLYTDATILKKLFEDNNLFKPASEDDLNGRPKVSSTVYHVYSWDDDSTNEWLYNQEDAIKVGKWLVRQGLDRVRIEVMENEESDDGDTIWTGGLEADGSDDGNYTRAQADEDVKNGVVNEDNQLFKPASNDDQKEREEAHIASLGPKFAELTKTCKETTDIEENYIEQFEQGFVGNYGSIGDSYNPRKASFNIKVNNFKIPYDVQEKLEKNNLENIAYEQIYSRLPDQLEWFVEDLMTQYPFIDEWSQEGRSGGHLVLELASVRLNGEARDILDAYDHNDLEDYMGDSRPQDYDYTIKTLKDYQINLSKRIQDLTDIETKIEATKKDIVKEYSSPEYWKEFLTDHGISTEETEE